MINPIINPTQDQLLASPSGEYLWIDEDDDDVLLQLHKRYMQRAIACFGGRTRNVFLMPCGYVVKIPKNMLGIGDNDWEGSVSNSEESIGDPSCIQYPKTRLAYQNDIPIVFMEYIAPLTSEEIIDKFGSEPDWVLRVDSGQVGINKNGRLVAYDYGLN